jgi:hypothetical protein
MTEPSTSFDSPWKDIVETYLPESLLFILPQFYIFFRDGLVLKPAQSGQKSENRNKGAIREL